MRDFEQTLKRCRKRKEAYKHLRYFTANNDNATREKRTNEKGSSPGRENKLKPFFIIIVLCPDAEHNGPFEIKQQRNFKNKIRKQQRHKYLVTENNKIKINCNFGRAQDRKRSYN